MPCGVQFTRMKHINSLSRNVEYLASRDATIMGSRNGHAPIFLWYTLNRKGFRGFQKDVQRCLRNAHYLKERLREAKIGVMLNELSSTVVFERPLDEAFILKWQLACQVSVSKFLILICALIWSSVVLRSISSKNMKLAKWFWFLQAMKKLSHSRNVDLTLEEDLMSLNMITGQDCTCSCYAECDSGETWQLCGGADWSS